LLDHIIVERSGELNSDISKPSTANNPITVTGIIPLLSYISNKRHKTPNPIIAINVFIFLFD
jgi:hypothetical protein